MTERHDIVLREAPGPSPSPPGLIQELRKLIEEAFSETVPNRDRPDGDWVRTKGQEAKACEIRTAAMKKLDGLEAERERLIYERDEAQRRAQDDQRKSELDYRARIFELKIERFKAVVDSLRTIKELNIKLSARVIRKIEAALADISEPGVS